jgi:hypothetical protein
MPVGLGFDALGLATAQAGMRGAIGEGRSGRSDRGSPLDQAIRGGDMKVISISALALLLGACGTSPAVPSERPASAGASATLSASASAAPSDTASCELAFAALDLGELARAPELSAVGDALDDTIAQCPTLTSWRAILGRHLRDVDLGAIDSFLASRCSENEALAHTPICAEVASN